MDYSRWYIGDRVLYQGQACANTVTNGKQYEIIRLTHKPRHAFISDDSGRDKLIQMGSLFVKVGGK